MTDTHNIKRWETSTPLLDEAWQQFLDGGGNQPTPLGEGNYYIGKLIAAEDVDTHIGGPTGHYARLTFNIEGAHLDYTASLPSMYISFEACMKLQKALEALNWDGTQTVPSLIGRTCWCRIGRNRRGYEVVDDLRAAFSTEDVQ